MDLACCCSMQPGDAEDAGKAGRGARVQRSGVPARTGSGMTRGRRGGGRRSKVVVVEDAGRLDPRDGRRGLQDPADGMAMDDGIVVAGPAGSSAESFFWIDATVDDFLAIPPLGAAASFLRRWSSRRIAHRSEEERFAMRAGMAWSLPLWWWLRGRRSRSARRLR